MRDVTFASAAELPEPYRSQAVAAWRALKYERALQRMLNRDDKLDYDVIKKVMEKGFDITIRGNFAVYNPSTIVGWGFAVTPHRDQDQYLHTHTIVRVTPAADPRHPAYEYRNNIGELMNRLD